MQKSIKEFTITQMNKNFSNPKELFDMHPTIIPEDETFMMGDNSDHSNDSRFRGSVPI